MAEPKAFRGYVGRGGKMVPVLGTGSGGDVAVVDGFDSTSVSAASSANNARILNQRINNLEADSDALFEEFRESILNAVGRKLDEFKHDIGTQSDIIVKFI